MIPNLSKLVHPVLFICLLGGCASVQIRSAPLPTTAEAEQNRTVQTRLLKVPFETVFPKVIGVLLDDGYIVSSANERLGLVSFSQQWLDKDQHNANIRQEGTLFFERAGADATSVRVLMSGSWQVVSRGGGYSASSAMVGRVAQSSGEEQYKVLLDVVEKGLLVAR